MTGTGQPVLPFDRPAAPAPRKRKRGAARRTSEASLDAFEAIKRRRVKLYRPILEAIVAHGPAAADCLTGREILRALILQDVLPAGAEVLSIRPRLTELLQAGCLENPLDPGDAVRFFLKTVTGEAPASVWRITGRGRLLIEHLERNGGV